VDGKGRETCRAFPLCGVGQESGAVARGGLACVLGVG
jgi:hypothetical protein